MQVAFDGLDIIFAITTGTVEILIEHRRRGGLQRGDHKAWVITRRHDFGLKHHAPRLGPGRRAIEELLIQVGAGRGPGAVGVREGGPLLMELACFLHQGGRLAEQDGVPGQAEDEIAPAPVGDDLDHLGCGEMAISTHQDVGLGPVATEIGQETGQDHRVLRAGRPRARAEVRHDQCMGGPFKNEERQITIVLIVMVIERKFLLPMRRVVGMIHVKDNGGRGFRVTSDEVVHQGLREPIEVFAVHTVLEP